MSEKMKPFRWMKGIDPTHVINVCRRVHCKMITIEGKDKNPDVTVIHGDASAESLVGPETCAYSGHYLTSFGLDFVCLKEDPVAKEHIDKHRNHMTAKGDYCSGPPDFGPVEAVVLPPPPKAAPASSRFSFGGEA